MKILYLGVEHDRLDPKRGFSFEHQNFYNGLRNIPGCDVAYLPLERAADLGRKRFNRELLEKTELEKPDLIFCFMYSDELDPAALEALKKKTVTLAWFADDHWRFWNYTRRYAPRFSWAVTTYAKAVPLYRRIGAANVIHSQWGANLALYRPATVPAARTGDVSFVGGWSRPRAKIVAALEKRGIAVEAYGNGWPRGRLSFNEMIALFGKSKINLALNPVPGFWNANSLGRLLFRASGRRIVPDIHPVQNARAWLCRGVRQIKARHFEIPACGGFVMTEPADDIESYYAPDREMVFYRTVPELAEKIRYYLAHEDERERIARAGYERTIREHSYAERFKNIFEIIGKTG